MVLKAIEEHARLNLGLIKPRETFIQMSTINYSNIKPVLYWSQRPKLICEPMKTMRPETPPAAQIVGSNILLLAPGESLFSNRTKNNINDWTKDQNAEHNTVYVLINCPCRAMFWRLFRGWCCSNVPFRSKTFLHTEGGAERVDSSAQCL